VSAVDLGGGESACSSIASGVARAEFAVSPTGSVNFGSVAIGSFAEQTFTVSNTAGGTVAGAADVGAPFSIVSGSPFTLSGTGATQAVKVRFTPTTSTTASATVSFTANSDTISGIVTATGTGTAADTIAPSIAITSPTSASTFVATGPSLALGGTASDNVGVTQVTWTNNLGGSGTATGTTSWSVGAIALQAGTNIITVTARDAAGNSRPATLTVTLSGSTPSTVAVTGPVISQPTASAKPTSVTISWTTNKPGDTQVEYGTATTYGGLTTLDSRLVTSHSQVIKGLARQTLYHFRVKSRDAANNLTVSSDFTFSTR